MAEKTKRAARAVYSVLASDCIFFIALSLIIALV